MTVPAQPNTRTEAVGNGVTTIFAFEFLCLESRDLQVFLDGAVVSPSQYTVTGLGQHQGGTVVFLSAPTDGAKILMELAVVADRQNDYQDFGDLFAGTVNFDFDRIWLAIQSAVGNLRRALQLGLYDADGSGAYRANNNRITNLGDPQASRDAVHRQWVDARISEAAIDGAGEFVVERLADTEDPSNGAGMVGFLQRGTGTVPRTTLDKLRERVTPLDFGAVGDGVADDSTAIERAVLDGRPLDWLGRTYRITQGINLIVSHAIDWTSQGATIFHDPPAHTQAVIRLLVRPHTHRIMGALNVDANRKANIGFWMYADVDHLGPPPAGYPSLYAQGIAARNVYRATTAFVGGDGIRIEGGWNIVQLDSPRAENCKQAPGADGGIFGITVMRTTPSTENRCPYQIIVNDPYVDGVWSEDEDVQMDQDGLRLYTSYAYTEPQIGEFSIRVDGGVIRNCRNRSIKIQGNLAVVTNTKLVRTDEVGGQAVGNVSDIDFQHGVGIVSNLEFHYTGRVPAWVVQGTHRPENREIPYLSVANVSGYVGPGVVLPRFASILVNGSGVITRWTANVSNVTIAGEVNSGFGVGTSTTGGEVSVLNINGFSAKLVDSLAQSPTATSNKGLFRVNATNCVNRTPTPVDILNDWNGSPSIMRQISATNCIGFNDYARRYPGEEPNAMIVDTLMPNNIRWGPLTRYKAYVVNDGAFIDLPRTTYNTGGISGIVEVSNSMNDSQAHGIFAVGNDGVLKLAGGSRWTTGTTSDPGSGDFRIWINAGLVRIANHSGVNRTLGIWMK